MKIYFKLILASVCMLTATISWGQDMPPMEPGKCYAKCITPDQYSTEEKRIMVKPAYKKLRVTPAEYRTEEEQIMIKPASKRFVYVPATFKTVQRTIQVEDAYNEIKTTAATFTGGSERILVQPKSVRWEYQRNTTNCKSPDGDCIVACAVEYPEEYRNVPTQVIGREAGFTKTQKGGRSITVDIQEVATAARVDEIDIPAEYTTITKRILVKDEEVQEEEVPAEYAVETMRVMSSQGGQAKWEEILCDIKVTGNTTMQVQRALISRGYDPGPADGVMGAKTKSALAKFQQDNGLPVGGMTIATLKALGVNY